MNPAPAAPNTAVPNTPPGQTPPPLFPQDNGGDLPFDDFGAPGPKNSGPGMPPPAPPGGPGPGGFDGPPPMEMAPPPDEPLPFDDFGAPPAASKPPVRRNVPTSKRGAAATVFDIERNWMKLVEEFRKTNPMQAGYFGSTIVRVGSPTESPFSVEIVYPKGMDAAMRYAQKDPSTQQAMHDFLEESLGRTVRMRMSHDETVSTSLSEQIVNRGMTGEKRYEQEMEEYSSMRILKNIFKTDYKFTRKVIPTLPAMDSEREAELESQPEDDE